MRFSSFELVQPVPGLEADFMQADFYQLYGASEIQDLDLIGLRVDVEKLPCCVLGGDREPPRFNYTKDPYYTDGLRVVLILGEHRNPLYDVDFLPWERPGQQVTAPDSAAQPPIIVTSE